ncbi:hypothetical protein KUTeg_023237 [Tegillarca granosa]|uniref:C1q domain-containing protein n=1 Tax=Tegillarca granosa TaxID=220873 RepID=A0ABQ9E5L9_TEGGR|nr:hypothetical protein KUTeg_023237 [Tegillarca granosa]
MKLTKLRNEIVLKKQTVYENDCFKHCVQKFISVLLTVAFYAWLSNGNTKRTIIKYNQVKTNIGKGYNPNTGKFVAPVSGIYMLAITVSTYRVGYSHVDIIKNGHVICVVLSENLKDLDSDTKVVVLKLMASDTIYMIQRTSYSLWTDLPHALNTFSGFLIKKIPS